jgi:hypothetical protein
MSMYIVPVKMARGLRYSLVGQDARFPPSDPTEFLLACRMHSVVFGGLRVVSFVRLIRLPACLLLAWLLVVWLLVRLKLICLLLGPRPGPRGGSCMRIVPISALRWQASRGSAH